MGATLGLLFAAAFALGQSPAAQTSPAPPPLARCFLLPFRSPARPEGADVTMIVVSDGRPCAIPSWGIPTERRNPATAATISGAPRHGKAVFISPRLEYTPDAGYVGEDEFAYEATVIDSVGAEVVLRFRIKADVRAASFAPPVSEAPPVIPAGLRPNVDPAFEKGRQALEQRKYEDALKAFREASDASGQKCGECFYAMAKAYEGLGAAKNVASSCDRAIDLAGSDTVLAVLARQTKGVALQTLAETKDQNKLREAETEVRAALSLDRNAAFLHCNLGVVLMQERRDDEGIEELKQELLVRPKSVYSDQIARLIANPRRAREAYAPEFSITTLSREFLELNDLRGKVVVLDFWGTWCPPCVQAVPWLRDMEKKHAKDPFVLVGVSSDSDEPALRDFLSKNQMEWPEYWDRDRKFQQIWSVRAWPTYVLIDDEGIVRFRTMGNNPTERAKLEDAIKRQLKIVAGKQKPNR
jgi:thiol-disulfide isomerase/thioredoxin